MYATCTAQHNILNFVVPQVMAGLHRELSESRAAAQHAHQLKATESESSGQVISNLQEQLSQLRSHMATYEQALHAKSLEVGAEQGRTTAAQAGAASLQAKTSELEREVGCLKQSLSSAEETFSNAFKVWCYQHPSIAVFALARLVNLQRCCDVCVNSMMLLFCVRDCLLCLFLTISFHAYATSASLIAQSRVVQHCCQTCTVCLISTSSDAAVCRWSAGFPLVACLLTPSGSPTGLRQHASQTLSLASSSV